VPQLYMTLYRRNLPHLEKPGGTYFVTFKTADEFMLPDDAKSLVLDHCLYDHGNRYTLHSCVVMRTHAHLLLTPLATDEGYFRLATIMNGIKGSSSHSVNKLLHRSGPLWRDESFDHLIRSEEDFEDKLLYIQTNAVETGCRRAEDYPWYWREGMPASRRKRKPKRKDPWLTGK
jgi:REP element-mobilizing transposase RayT